MHREISFSEEKNLTWLYSSSQVSSSQADSHLSTLSMISFLVKESSFAFAICTSMLERTSQGSTKPEYGVFLDYSKNDPSAIFNFMSSQHTYRNQSAQ